MKEENNSNKEQLSINRIEGLSDGVFGIAMTLLIFKLDIPDITPDAAFNSALKENLLGMLPQFENFFVSFMLLGFFWTRHQLQFKHIKISDRGLLWINIFFLAFVSLLPFTTGLLMKYTGHGVPVFLYCGNLTIAALVLALHWSYANKNNLIDSTLNKAYVRSFFVLVYLMPITFGICAIAGLFSARTGLTLLYTIPFIFFFVRRIQNKKK